MFGKQKQNNDSQGIFSGLENGTQNTSGSFEKKEEGKQKKPVYRRIIEPRDSGASFGFSGEQKQDFDFLSLNDRVIDSKNIYILSEGFFEEKKKNPPLNEGQKSISSPISSAGLSEKKTEKTPPSKKIEYDGIFDSSQNSPEKKDPLTRVFSDISSQKKEGISEKKSSIPLQNDSVAASYGSPFLSFPKDTGLSNKETFSPFLRDQMDQSSFRSESIKKQEYSSPVSIPQEGASQGNSFYPLASKKGISEVPFSAQANYGYRGQFPNFRSQARKKPSRGIFIKIVFFFLIMTLFGILGVGGYLYWQEKKGVLPWWKTPVADRSPIVIENSNTPSAKKNFVYDWEMANAVLVDETQGKTVLEGVKQAMQEFLQYDGDGVLEFFFADGQKNFSTLSGKDMMQRMGIIFPNRFDSLIQDVGDGRLFMVKKGLLIRTVIVVPVSSRENALKQFLVLEPDLLKIFSPLYINEISTEGISPKFKDQTYQEYAIRFFNLDIQKEYSLDYTMRRDSLLVATSKDSLREVLDFLDGKRNITSRE